jgi:hypothetical protein
MVIARISNDECQMTNTILMSGWYSPFALRHPAFGSSIHFPQHDIDRAQDDDAIRK